MARSIGLALGFMAAALGSAVAAPSEFEQRIACMGDAVRLCSDKIPDRGAIEACMAARHDQLSQGCVTVFDASRLAGRAQTH